jgi:nicotinamide-nucleotide adenylyltransferase
MLKIERALMIGRFQPFHKGHLLLIKDILSDCEQVIIAIGSSQFNFTPSNPFTAGERVHMIHEALIENNTNLNRIYIIPVGNSENNAIWLGQLRSTVPNFDTIYSGNEFVKALVKSDSRLRLIVPTLYRKRTLNGTYIRNRILTDKTWEDLVPGSTYRIINEINGPDRVRMISDTHQSGQASVDHFGTNYYPKIK